MNAAARIAERDDVADREERGRRGRGREGGVGVAAALAC